MIECSDCKGQLDGATQGSCAACHQAVKAKLLQIGALLREFGQCPECYRTFREESSNCTRCGEARKTVGTLASA